MKAETVTFTQTVKIEDADGVAIHEGSVLEEITDGERGVVLQIGREGERGPMMMCVGDLRIRTTGTSQRITNRYSAWRHIPKERQTYQERLDSWLHTSDNVPDYCPGESRDEKIAISGIMAILPEDIVDWDYDSGPYSIEDALGYLVKHLSNQK